MKIEQLQILDDLTLDIHFDLAVLLSAVKNSDEELEYFMLKNFVERIFNNSKEIRNIFNNELLG